MDASGLAGLSSLHLLVLVWAAGVGACVGSFLNVVVARLPQGESIVRPRSRCPRCKAPIAWYDNIPLLSYVLLRARCRACRAPIAARYPLVELSMAGLSAALVFRFGLAWELLLWWPLSAALLAVALLDIDHWWVPDVITLPAMGWAFALALTPAGLGVKGAALGLLPAVFLWLLGWGFTKLTGREGMGFGDIKLLAVIGLALGALAALAVLFWASVQGAVIGTVLRLTGGHQAKPSPAGMEAEDDWTPPPGAFPFGPFLVLATYEVLLLPEAFAGWLWDLGGLLSGRLG